MKPQLATANGLASRQGNGVGSQTRTSQATSGGQKKVASTKAYQGASTTPITVGGQTVNVFVSSLRTCLPLPGLSLPVHVLRHEASVELRKMRAPLIW